MGDKIKDRRERHPFDIFQEFKEIEKIMNDIIRQANEKNRTNPRVYVFSIRTDPRANSRGSVNVDKRRYINRAKELREPLVDIFDKKDEVVVVAEMPNVKKEDIELHRADNFLTISVNKPQQRKFKTVELPAEVNVEEAKINYKNGVLEVVLPKIEKKL
jgi:HSP20 family protein